MRRSFLASLLAIALVAAIALASCGGGDEGDGEAEDAVFAAEDVVAAFEEAAGGYEFEKETSLVDGATAYGPVSSADPEVVEPLNEALGDASVLWTVLIFDGPDPPLDTEAAKAAAFSSGTFEEAAPGIFLGASDIAYVPRANVVITGPVLDGDVSENTLVRWKDVLDSL